MELKTSWKVLIRKIIVNILNAAYNSVSLIVWKIRHLGEKSPYFNMRDFCMSAKNVLLADIIVVSSNGNRTLNHNLLLILKQKLD